MDFSRGILDLPLEILGMIFSEIKSFDDKLNMAQAHGMLGRAFAFVAADSFRKIEIESLPIIDWFTILPLCGSTVQSLGTRDVATAVVVARMAASYCPNLEEIYLPVRRAAWEDIKYPLQCLQNLIWVGLINDFECINVIETLRQLPKLQNLQLIKFNAPDLLGLDQLVNIETLAIENDNRNLFDVYKMCSSMKSLIALDVGFAEFRIPDPAAGVDLWPELDFLSIGFGVFHTSLPFFPHLKYLTIGNTSTELYNILGDTIDKYAETVESLRFCTDSVREIDMEEGRTIFRLKSLKALDCKLANDLYIDAYISQMAQLENVSLRNSSNITNYGIFMLVKRCQNLRKLDVVGCRHVNRRLLFPATRLLMTYANREDPSMLIRVGPEFG
ncbi:hypothetical protein KR018_002016, partial [Drosophila ironensis]